jgi:hypothetical protein
MKMRNDKNSLNNPAGMGNNAPAELEKEEVHIIVEIIEYVPSAVVSKTIIKKSTGNISVSSFATGEELAEKSVLLISTSR